MRCCIGITVLIGNGLSLLSIYIYIYYLLLPLFIYTRNNVPMLLSKCYHLIPQSVSSMTSAIANATYSEINAFACGRASLTSVISLQLAIVLRLYAGWDSSVMGVGC